MTAFRWIEGGRGEVVADGKRLEAVAYGPPPDEAPTIVMLHEGLGCVALWRDFPASSRRRPAGASSPIRAPATAGPIRSPSRARSTT